MQIFFRFAAPNDAPSVAAPLGTRFERRTPGCEFPDSSPPRTRAAPHRFDWFGAAISAPAPTRRAAKRLVRAAFGALALIATVALDQSAANAVTYTVNTTADSGVGSLRQAITDANASTTVSDEIVFDASVFGTRRTISLLTQLPTAGTGGTTEANLTITGPAVGLTVERNSAAPAVFRVFGSSTRTSLISVSNLTFTGGTQGVFTAGGSGAATDTGSLTLINCSIIGNTRTLTTSTFYGAGIQSNGGRVFLRGCTFSGNSVTYSGPASSNTRIAGAIYSGNSSVASEMFLFNCTISGNTVSDSTNAGEFGTILNYTSDDILRLTNCTVNGNTVTSGAARQTGGIFNNSVTSPGTTNVSLGNTIVAGNTSSANPDLSGAFVSNGNNLIGDGTGSTGLTNGTGGNQVGSSASPINPRLDALANNGGLTQTQALQGNSLALNAGSNTLATNAGLTTDQRGTDFPRQAGTSVDIGAYELSVPQVTTPTSANITATSATLGGNVTSQGLTAITERGVVYAPTATNSNPLIGGTGVLKATASGTTGVFTVAVTGLMASTGYSFKAYATNANGTSYTSVATFSTLAPPPNAAPVFGNSTYNFIFTQNRAISGARVSASDADGDALTYALTGGALPAGVTFNADGTFSGTPSATSTLITRTVSVSDGKGGSASASVTIQVSAETGVIISEFRFRGKSGALDEYVELYNKRGGPLNISGWSIQTRTATGLQTTVVPANKIIPPFGRYLFTGSVFSLTSYGTSDQTIAADVVNASGVALFNAAGTVQDAVGFTTSDAALKEGAGLLSAPTSNGEYAFVRDTTGTLPKDTADSTQDFVFVIADADATTPTALATVSGTSGNVMGRLGAPSPEGIADPAYANPIIAGALLDPNVSQSAAPNRERVGFVPNTSLGDLLIRRTITNNSGRPITKLRFSVASITSLGTPGPAGQADVRLVSSSDGNVTIGMTSVPVKGLTLETGATGQPALPLGGGLGSSAVLGEVSLGTPLANGASRSVVFRLQILKSGNFSVQFNFHVAPGS